MRFFSRRRTTDEPEVAESAAPETPDSPAEPVRDRGPWDRSEVDGIGKRVDLGSIWLPGREGMELRMEVDRNTKVVTAAAVALGDSRLQVQAFAAPKTEGVWDEIRDELAKSVAKQGGTVDDVPGPFGRELLARLQVRTPEGRTGHRAVRFLGVDGPRWFLRAVIGGKGAVDVKAAEPIESIFADIVVVRGSEPRAPRDLLPLNVPGRPTQPAVPDLVPKAQLNPLRRGPEITETR